MIKSNSEIEIQDDIMKIFSLNLKKYDKLRLLNWIFIRTTMPVNSHQYIHTFIDNYQELNYEIIKNPDSYDIKQKKKIIKWFNEIIKKHNVKNKDNVYKIKIEVDTELISDYSRGFMNLLTHDLITKKKYTNIFERKLKTSIKTCAEKLKYEFDIIEIHPVFKDNILVSIHIFIEEKYINISPTF